MLHAILNNKAGKNSDIPKYTGGILLKNAKILLLPLFSQDYYIFPMDYFLK
jgi:hypothetical protein